MASPTAHDKRAITDAENEALQALAGLPMVVNSVVGDENKDETPKVGWLKKVL